MAKMTPEQEALFALDWDLPRADLPAAAQFEYDRLKPGWEERNAAVIQARDAVIQARDERRQVREERIGAEVWARLQAGPTAITIVSWNNRTVSTFLLLAGCVWAVLGRPPWVRGPAVIGYLALVPLVSILLLYRVWRMRVRFDDRGVTVHQLLRTCHLGWPEVSHFADGFVSGGGGSGDVWALKIVLRDGRAVTVGATMGWGLSARRKVLATVRAVAELYAVPAQLTGNP
jgi:hypothetical protein